MVASRRSSTRIVAQSANASLTASPVPDAATKSRSTLPSSSTTTPVPSRKRGRPSLKATQATATPTEDVPNSAEGVFRGVIIPAMESSIASITRASAKNTPRSTRSSRGPSSVFTLDGSDSYDTPMTSGADTPEDSAIKLRSVDKGKRRKVEIETVDLTDTTGDAALAASLQEEEYNLNAPARRRSKLSRARSLSVISALDEDGENDSSSALSSLAEDSDFSEPIAKSLKRKRSTPSNDKGKSKSKGKGKQTLVLDTDESDVLDDASVEGEEEEGSDFESESESEAESDGEPGERTDTLQSAREAAFARHAERRQAWIANKQQKERDKLERAHPEIKTMWQELESQPKIPTAQAQQPSSINRKLKSFQLEGLNWMREQEKTKWKGGLLGDEMGMGKTIQAVSLIMSDYPAKSPTLVAVPPVALMQWSAEINAYTDGKLKVLIYHGTNSKAKGLSVRDLKSYDVIMISYSGLESIHRKEVKGWSRGENMVKEDSAIHSIHYHRIILDEAHSIKSRTTGVAKACFALKGSYKWCLSGTPVQNRIGEFFSLLRFLQVQPFANYFCKACPCSSLHWAVTSDHKCSQCHHRGLDHVSVFNQEILNPIIQSQGDTAKALAKLRLLTDRIMLRRVKRDYTSSMELPPKEIVIHNEFFGEIERDFSQSIMSDTNRQFDTYVSRGVMLNNYANIFGLIMQMRQVADHPDLLLKKKAEGGQNVLVCNICDEPAEDAVKSRCRHEFCRACVRDYIRTCDASDAQADCPRCHIALSIDLDQPEIEQDEELVKKSSIINRIKMENWTSSTKIEMLVYDLWKLRSKKRTLKSIVFSQFTSMLQLIEWRLRRAGFNTVMLDGSMSPAQRQKSIEYFMNNVDVEVFLVSLKAGGVALNLTEASRVFIVDPWWNPAAEWQSADRCHRIGQTRPCVITRLCIEDSVESRIVMLQEKKAHMINGTVNGDEMAMDKLSPEDMSFLFRGS